MNTTLLKMDMRNNLVKLESEFSQVAYKINLEILRQGFIDGKEWKLRAEKIDKNLEGRINKIMEL